MRETRSRKYWKPSWEKRLALWVFNIIAPFWTWIFKPKPSSDSNTPGRITVFAFWGIGDAILLTPLLRALRKRYPNATIELIGKGFLRDIFMHDPCVDEITVYAPPWAAHRGKYRFWRKEYRDLLRWIRARRKKQNDWIVTTRGDIREHLLAALIGGTRRFGYGNGRKDPLLNDAFPAFGPRSRTMHFADCSREIAKFMGCPDDGNGPRIALSDQERADALNALRSAGWNGQRPLVGAHLGAGIPIRCWPVERFQKVIEQTHCEISWLVVCDDPEGQGRRLKIPEDLGYTLYSGNLRQMFALLSHLDVFLCNDGGAMHAAAALGARVVAIFGPGSPEWFRPYGEGHRIAITPDMPCRPCHDYCSHKSPLCMESVTVKQVANIFSQVLQECSKAIQRCDRVEEVQIRFNNPVRE